MCSTSKFDLVKSLGADKVIDYMKEDFTESGQLYDIILDTIGKSPVSASKKSLKNNGFYLLTTFGLPKLVQVVWLSLTSNRKIFMGTLKERTDDMEFLRELIEAGELKIVVDRTYPLEEAVEAHRYVESGDKKGYVVITVEHDSNT